MPHFSRRTLAPIVKGGYRSFLPFVREDFSRHCAFCLFSELFAGAEENFELDHFRPKHRFPELLNDFYNLYYSCHPCNHIKRGSWPPPALEAQGICFVDLCKEDFASHFSVEKDGTWNGLTNAGNYTIEKLNLNRQHLVIVRDPARVTHWEIHPATHFKICTGSAASCKAGDNWQDLADFS